MATRKYTLVLGKGHEGVVEAAGTAITGNPAVEVNFDFNPQMTQAEALKLIDGVKTYIIENKWPPA